MSGEKLMNLDFYKRAWECPGSMGIYLRGACVEVVSTGQAFSGHSFEELNEKKLRGAFHFPRPEKPKVNNGEPPAPNGRLISQGLAGTMNDSWLPASL